MKSPFISRVVLHNYKNIQHCDVALGNLTVLVGPNGAGKSNFIDALEFVKDAMTLSLEHALRNRDGIPNILPVSNGPTETFGVRLDFNLDDATGHYLFLIAGTVGGEYTVVREECNIVMRREPPVYYSVDRGNLQTNVPHSKQASNISAQNFVLAEFARYAPFEELGRAVHGMNFYSIQPAGLRASRLMPLAYDSLERGGENAFAVLERLVIKRPDIVGKIQMYLSQIVPSVTGVRATRINGLEITEFPGSTAEARPLYSRSMSTGTLRMFAILLALFQVPVSEAEPLTLTAIEEPESSLHPAATAVLLDALVEASSTRQVLATSHSPDMLDNKHLDPMSILAVELVDGMARIGHLNEVGISMLRDQLMTPGELLRVGHAQPNSSPLTGDPEVLFRAG